MNEELTIQEVNRLKRIMDENIAVEINKFQRKTGLVLYSIDFTMHNTIGDPHPTIFLTTTVKL